MFPHRGIDPDYLANPGDQFNPHKDISSKAKSFNSYRDLAW
jgi:hypothetical protein